MFAPRFFAPRFFAPRYFPEVGLTLDAFTYSGTPHLVAQYATRIDPQYATTITLP